jgi:oligosaccharide translocation protein RFT1
MESSLLASTTTRLVLLQVFSKLLTFLPNQIIVRIASPQAYGTAAIQFELVLSTILFLSREGVRNASLRTARERRSEAEENVALLPIIVGTPITLLVSVIYFISSSSSRLQPHFTLSVAIISLAALIELLTEPFHIRAATSLRIDVRVWAEGAAITAKSVVSMIIMLLGRPELCLIAFALGQLAYSIALMSIYFKEFGNSAQRTLALKSTDSKG